MHIPDQLFSTKTYHQHYKRAEKQFPQYNFLYLNRTQNIADRISNIPFSPQTILNLSPWPFSIPTLSKADWTHCRELDSSPQKYDLIISCLYLHWASDIPSLLKKIYQALTPRGVFIGTFWGGETLCELRYSFLHAELELKGGITARISPFIKAEDGGRLLIQAGFTSPICDVETLTVSYISLYKLLKDLRGMGESNKLIQRQKYFTPRSLFQKTEEIYHQQFGATPKMLPATYQAITVTGWKSPLKGIN